MADNGNGFTRDKGRPIMDPVLWKKHTLYVRKHNKRLRELEEEIEDLHLIRPRGSYGEGEV